MFNRFFWGGAKFQNLALMRNLGLEASLRISSRMDIRPDVRPDVRSDVQPDIRPDDGLSKKQMYYI